MKLNLLPQYVSKGAAARTWMIASILLSALSIFGAIFLVTSSKASRDAAETAANDLVPQAQAVVTLAKTADAIGGSSASVVRNIRLADAMQQHPAKITGFYRDVIPYIPSFFRVNAMSMTPIDGSRCTLTLTGTIQTYQQYADLMLALLRIPGAQTVGRTGFVLDSRSLPNVTEDNVYPEFRKASETPLPLDPSERIGALVARAGAEPTGFTGSGNYAGPVDQARLAIPKWQNITVSVVLQTPGAQVPVANPAPGGAPAMNPGAPTPGGAPTPQPGAAPAGPVYNFLVPVPRDSLPAGATPAPGGGAPANNAPGVSLGRGGAERDV